MRVLSLAVLVGLAQAQTSRVCNAPVDLVFILDESGSVGSVDNEKALLFMEDVLDRFDVGTSANQAHVAMVAFSTTTQIDFPLDRHFTTAAAKAGVQASVYNGGITCTGGAMRLVSDQILCAGCPGRRANTPAIALILTDGNPSNVGSCQNYGSQQNMDRTAEIIRLKGLVNRIIPVGIGYNIATQFLTSLGKDMPAPGYIQTSYNNLAGVLDDLATAACPTLPPSKAPTPQPTRKPTQQPTKGPTKRPTKQPTAHPSKAPTPLPTKAPTANPTQGPTTAPTKVPTHHPTQAPTYGCVCDATEKLACDMGAGRPGFCFATTSGCQVKACGCGNGFACATTACSECTTAPTAVPTAVPTSAPSHVPTFHPTATPSAVPTAMPTAAPSAVPTAAPTGSPTVEPSAAPSTMPSSAPTTAPTPPTTAPTYWALFDLGDESQEKSAAKTTAVVAAASLGTLAIVAIIIAAIVGILLLIAMAAGIGIFAARRKLFNVDGLHIEGEVVAGKAVACGTEIQMTEVMAKELLESGAITPGQFTEMGYGGNQSSGNPMSDFTSGRMSQIGI